VFRRLIYVFPSKKYLFFPEKQVAQRFFSGRLSKQCSLASPLRMRPEKFKLWGMLELHAWEQYFWDAATIDTLVEIAARFEYPACLCAPMLGQELEARRIPCATLDVDERFAHLSGFSRFDVYRPTWHHERFGALFCDPPFWIVSLSQLFAAVRLIAQHDFSLPFAICYPSRRGANLCATFHSFGLKTTSFFPTYRTVSTSEERGKIEFFANFAW